MVDTGLESEKDTKRVEPRSLPSRKIVLFLVLGDNDLSPCAHSFPEDSGSLEESRRCGEGDTV